MLWFIVLILYICFICFEEEKREAASGRLSLAPPEQISPMLTKRRKGAEYGWLFELGF